MNVTIRKLVLIMLCVKTLLEAIGACVKLDILEMEMRSAQVSTCLLSTLSLFVNCVLFVKFN